MFCLNNYFIIKMYFFIIVEKNIESIGKTYYNIDPEHTLYVPAHLRKSGKNDIFVFELHSHSNDIQFTDKPDLGK